MFTVSTGFLTSICAIASLVSVSCPITSLIYFACLMLLKILVWGQTLIYVAFYFSLGRRKSSKFTTNLPCRDSEMN